LSAQAKVDVKPAPPTAHGPLSQSGVDEGEMSDEALLAQAMAGGDFGSYTGRDQDGEQSDEEWLDWADLKKQQEQAREVVVEHDEL
jgi:heat shock protein beta